MIIVLGHRSKAYRRKGQHLLDTCLASAERIDRLRDVLVIDNGSDVPLSVPPEVRTIRIFDQRKGFSWAFNLAAERAIGLGEKILHFINDDIHLNKSFNVYERDIMDEFDGDKDHTCFGPLMDDCRAKWQCVDPEKTVSKFELPPVIPGSTGRRYQLIGAFISMTPGFFRKHGPIPCDGIHALGGIESIQFHPGAQAMIVTSGLFHHDAIGGWGQIKKLVSGR